MLALKLAGAIAVVFLTGFLAYAGSLWLSGRAFRAGIVSLRRALLLSLLLSVASLALSALLLVADIFGRNPGNLFVYLLLSVIVPVVIIMRVFRASAWRSVAIWLLSFAIYLPVVAAMVFGMRVYLFEAFIVSSGNMAETLLGLHKSVECPQCGRRFLVNASVEADSDPSVPPLFVSGCTCPQCGSHLVNDPQHPLPATQSGDRMLVVKGILFDATKDLSRFDLIVFRPPNQSSAATQPYVERLIGLPGETIAIHAGKVYRCLGEPGDEQTPADDFDKGRFEILRKSPAQVLALRRLVYDNDVPAANFAMKRQPRWIAEGDTDWSEDERGALSHTSGKEQATGPLDWVRYRHPVAAQEPGEAPKAQLITDFSSYNAYEVGSRMPVPIPANRVADLLLECQVSLAPDSGEFVLELAKGGDRFRAAFQPASGECELSRHSGDNDEKLATARTPLIGRGHCRIRFANIDDQLLVWVDDVLPFGAGVEYAPASVTEADAKNDLRPAGIATRGGLVVRKLTLWRDTYYTAALNGFPRDPDAPRTVDFADPDTREPLAHLPTRAFTVPPGSYFVLGDNSPESADSRVWGTVPASLLLGRAVLVYYPLERVGWLH